jgi:hypothetical protein
VVGCRRLVNALLLGLGFDVRSVACVSSGGWFGVTNCAPGVPRALGLSLTVRYVATHARVELSEQEAMERLAAYSYLARLLDQCAIETASVSKTCTSPGSPAGHTGT